jgi:hypothetical protein
MGSKTESRKLLQSGVVRLARRCLDSCTASKAVTCWESSGSAFMWYRRPQGLLAGLRDAIDRAPMIVRSSLDPAFRRHAGNGVFARWVQFFNGKPFGRAHPLQVLRSIECGRWLGRAGITSPPPSA